MLVKSIAECSPWSILQYFRPSLSYHLSFGSLFCLVLSAHFTQVLLFCQQLQMYLFLKKITAHFHELTKIVARAIY